MYVVKKNSLICINETWCGFTDMIGLLDPFLQVVTHFCPPEINE